MTTQSLRAALDNVATKITWKPDKTALVHDAEALNTLIGEVVMATAELRCDFDCDACRASRAEVMS